MSLANAILVIADDIQSDLEASDGCFKLNGLTPGWAWNIIKGYENALRAAVEASKPDEDLKIESITFRQRFPVTIQQMADKAKSDCGV